MGNKSNWNNGFRNTLNEIELMNVPAYQRWENILKFQFYAHQHDVINLFFFIVIESAVSGTDGEFIVLEVANRTLLENKN